MAALWSGFRGRRLCIDLIVQLLLGLACLPASAAVPPGSRSLRNHFVFSEAALEEILQFLERQFRSAGQLLSFGPGSRRRADDHRPLAMSRAARRAERHRGAGFNRPPAAPAFHPEQFAWTAHLLEGQQWPSGGARVPEKGLQLRPEGDRRFWGSAAGRMPAFPSALRLAFATLRVVIHAR